MLRSSDGRRSAARNSSPFALLCHSVLIAFAVGAAAVPVDCKADPNVALTPPARVGGAARVERNLQTDDNWQIYITYYTSKFDRESLTKETPVVILLHGDKENRLVWEGAKGLAPRLQQEGFAVIAVDLRKHGQSTNMARLAGDSPAGGKNTDGNNLQAADYENMVDFDMEAVKQFIYSEHQAKRLNMNKIGIIGAESSCGVALCYAVVDWYKTPYDDAAALEMKTPRGQDVRALVLLSPPQRVKGLPIGTAITDVRNPDWNIAILTVYGKLNPNDSKDAKAIHRRLYGSPTSKANADRIVLAGYNANVRGTDLLGKKDVDADGTIIKFLNFHLKNVPDSDWRDRQSRLSKR